MNSSLLRAARGAARSLRLLPLLPVMSLAQNAQHLRWQAPGPNGPAPEAWQRSLRPDGSERHLSVAAGAAAGEALALPSGRVRWAGVFPDALAGLAPRGLQWIGDLDAEPPRLEELTALAAPSACLSAPPGRDLAAHMDWTPFGIEERVAALQPDSTLAWRVAPGQRPAGVYSARAWRLPTRAARDWQLELTLRGQGTLRLGLTPETRTGFGDPESLHELSLTPEARTHRLPLPPVLAAAKALRVSLVAGGDSAEFTLESLRWLPAPQKAAAAPADLSLGVWDWSANPSRWLELRPLWKEAGVRVLQLALPRHAEEGPPPYLKTLQTLREDGFEVVAVEGDPHMVLPNTAPAVHTQHRRLAQWPELASVQYDVEPYLLPGFALQPDRWYQAWGGLYASLAGLAPKPLEAVVPFWLLQEPHGPALLDGFARHCQRVVVMNYRSDPVEALAWATAWLEWSQSHRLPVGLAIECGPVPDSPRTIFHQAERGRLWVSPWPGQGTAVVLFEDPVAPATETECVAEVTRRDIVPGVRTSMAAVPPREVRALLEALRSTAASLQLPASLAPRLLLHEPSVELLRELGR